MEYAKSIGLHQRTGSWGGVVGVDDDLDSTTRARERMRGSLMEEEGEEEGGVVVEVDEGEEETEEKEVV